LQCRSQDKQLSQACECYKEEVEVVELTPFISNIFSTFQENKTIGIIVARSVYEIEYNEVIIYTVNNSKIIGQKITETDTMDIEVNNKISTQIIETLNNSFEGSIIQFCQPMETGSYLKKFYMRFNDGKRFSYTSPYDPPQFASESCLKYTTASLRDLMLNL
jgi:hypothetical protein